MATKRSATRHPPEKRTRRVAQPSDQGNWRKRARFYLGHTLLWCLLAIGAYWLWLDREVARTFETRRWSLPARVYGRPLELYPGAPVDRQRLLRELEFLGYQRTGSPRAQGQYAASETRVEFFSRGFKFWDFPELGRHARVDFSAKKIARIADASSGKPIALMRLEAAEIGRINQHEFEDRKLLSFTELPPKFVSGLLAVEDRRFFAHHGVDIFGLARALLSNLRALRFVQGGSTLTQQLVKNFYLTRERTIARKITELMMSVSLELRYEKIQILETYVNEVFLGQDGNRAIHGFGLASQFYFGIPLAELDTPSLASLIGMVKGPSRFDPRRHPQAAQERRNVVLDVMQREGLLNPEEVAAWRQKPIRTRPSKSYAAEANPAFMALVKRQLLRDYSAEDLRSAGLNIYTTLDPALQNDAEVATRTTLTAIEQARNITKLQAALVVVEPHSGEILALIGDRNPGYAGFNRALDMQRPIGSIVKPFIYALALSQARDYSLVTALSDQAVTLTDTRGAIWQPQNFDGNEHGSVSMLDALTRSLNLATVNLGLALGLQHVRDYLIQIGFRRDLQAYPSILLGAIDSSPLEMAELYAPFANDGFEVPLRAIVDVTDQNNLRLTRYGLKIRAVMQPTTAALVRHAMIRVAARGTARSLQSAYAASQPLAGKTGTSNDNRDSWFVGFGANRLAVAWVGRDDNSPTGLTGGSGALRLWSAAMQGAGIEPLAEELPAQIVLQSVDLQRGVIIPSHCNNAETVPIHLASVLPIMATCATSEDDASKPQERTGILQRLKGFLN